MFSRFAKIHYNNDGEVEYISLAPRYYLYPSFWRAALSPRGALAVLRAAWETEKWKIGEY